MAERTAELRYDIEQTRDHMSTTLDAIGDRVSPGRMAERRWERVRQSSRGLSERVMGTPRETARADRSRPEGAGNTVSGVAGSVGEAVSSAPDRIESATQGNPLAAGAVAFGLGVLFGSLAPVSREEVRVAEQVREPLQDQAKAFAHDVAEPVKSAAQEGIDQTRQVASQAAGEVTDHARTASRDVSAEASRAKDEVAGQAEDSARQARS